MWTRLDMGVPGSPTFHPPEALTPVAEADMNNSAEHPTPQSFPQLSLIGDECRNVICYSLF